MRGGLSSNQDRVSLGNHITHLPSPQKTEIKIIFKVLTKDDSLNKVSALSHYKLDVDISSYLKKMHFLSILNVLRKFE